MRERDFIKQNMIQLNIKESIIQNSGKAAEIGQITMEKTPLGEKIIISTTRPGMIIGRGGSTIKELTRNLKSRFRLENPQIETAEITNPYTSAQVVATRIAKELERFGPSRFKGIGYRELNRIMEAGSLGVEIVIDGPIPGARSRKWRFHKGYMKKCGFISDNLLDKAQADAVLKKGTVGISVTIMHAHTPLPDKVDIVSPEVKEVEEKSETKDPTKEEKPNTTKKAPAKKKAEPKKVPAKKKVVPKKETKAKSITKKTVKKEAKK
jgi:small subunit ribosomal protein S3